MINGGLLSKTVKTDNPHFIGFLYPTFPYVESLMLSNYNDRPGIIHTGMTHLNREEMKMLEHSNKGQVSVFPYSKEYLTNTGHVFISTYAADERYDIDLTDKTALLDLVYSKWGLDYKQYLVDTLEMLLELDIQDFYDFVKICWLSREDCANAAGVGVYNSKTIYKLLNAPIEKVYATVLSIKSNMSLSAFEYSLAKFIRSAKAQNYDTDIEDDYNATMKAFDTATHDKEKEIAVVLSKYRSMKHDKKLKLIWLIKQLKSYIEGEER